MSARNFPYGYKMTDGVIVTDESEAEYVRQIFEMKNSGIGVCEIGKRLFEKNIPFFFDTISKSVKKASAILYKPVYAGNEKYPAIVDKELFDEIQKMKPKVSRKKKKDKLQTAASEEYELIDIVETEELRTEIIMMITERKTGSEEISKMIVEFAGKRYNCIKRKEEIK